MNELIKSKGFKIAFLVAAFILVVLISFAAGAKIGFRKALFSCNWGKNYERNFMGPRPSFGKPGFFGGMMRDFEGRDFRNSHGLSGTIISITDNKIIIKDRDNKENTVEVTDKTIIHRRHFSDLKLKDLKIDDRIVVIGKPDESGIIEAILIRVFEK